MNKKLFSVLLLCCAALSSYAQWVSKASLGTGRAQHGAAYSSITGKVYAFVGYTASAFAGDATGLINSMEVYDPIANVWSSGTATPTSARGIAYTTGTDNKIYYGGGHDGSSVSNGWFVYNPSTATWSTLASMPTGEWEAAAASYAGKIYVAGGESSPTSLMIYDIATNTWSAGASLPAGRMQHRMIAAPNGKLYLFGGTNGFGGSIFNTILSYDIAGNTWSTLGTTLPGSVNSMGAALASDGRIYIVGGKQNYLNNGSPFLSSTYIFDPSTSTVITGPSLPIIVGEDAAAASPEGVYCVGGINGGTTALANTFFLSTACTGVDQPANQRVCNNSSTAAVNFTGGVSGTVYSWTNNNTSIGLAASGTGNISSFTATNTGSTSQTATINVTPTFNTAGSQTFNYTGGIQNFTVPAGVTQLTVKAWGGGGGGGGNDCALGARGGGGGYVTSVISVSPGDVMSIYVASGGGPGTSSVAATGAGAAGFGYGNGGTGGTSGSVGVSGGGGGGGGGSAVLKGSTVYVVAAGGGGGGGAGCNNGGAAGGGGGTNGSSAAAAAGGSGSTGSINGGNGQNRNATGGNIDGGGGGGGGGGYLFGGNGGSTATCDCGAGGGAGGSGFGTTVTNGSGFTPGNNADPDLTSCVGCVVGGNSGSGGVTAGGNGFVVLSWVSSCSGSPKTFTITVDPTLVVTSTTVTPQYPMSGQEIQTIYLNYPASAQSETIATTPSGGSGAYSYLWQKSNCNGATMSTISGASNSSYTWSPTSADACSSSLDNIYTFTVTVSDGVCPSIASTKKLNLVTPYTATGDVQLCHRAALRGATLYQTMTVPASQVSTHLGHGDILGGNCSFFTGKQVQNLASEPDQFVAVYPNPNTGVFVVELAEVQSQASIMITDVTGKLITAATLNKDKAPVATFDMTSFSKGMYLIQIRDGGLTYRSKVVVE